ncbi:MAG: DUF502 domain-containing protein, partial [Alphaproteobacteria bacterium]|nr:DUF502 domain-containing protein [Alphaproteobacteria bacterium]
MLTPVRTWRPGARLRTYLAAGILVTAPVGLTLYLAWSVISYFDRKVTPLIPSGYNPESFLYIPLPGLGLLIALIVLALIGWLTTNVLGRFLVGMADRVLTHMPVLSNIYSAIKQIIETTVSAKSGSFREVVLVEFPRPGLWAVGFVTGKPPSEIDEAGGGDIVSVFCPTSPNPTSGYLVYAKRSELRFVKLTVEEGLKLIVSSGIVTPDHPRAARLARPQIADRHVPLEQ